MTDRELLKRYIEEKSNEAFAALVGLAKGSVKFRVASILSLSVIE